MSPAIDVHDLHVSYGTQSVLAGLDLTVAPGEVFALLGPNGAGKTTAISVLTTLAVPASGTARVAGFDVVTDPVEVRRRIALTGQSTAVDDSLTATENLTMLGRLSGLSSRAARARASELLAQFALTDAASRRVKTFSGGMRRRLDLALSFVVTPEVLFLDEPTTGVDPRSRLDLWSVIRTLADAGTTVFLTTQYLEEADLLADRVAILDGGRIVQTGTPEHLKSLVGSDTLVLSGTDGDALGEIPTDGTVAGLRRALDAIPAAEAGAAVALRRPTLDDVFLNLTASPADARIPEEVAS
ncbi:ABC transporter ATP-binding protein [Microbacterium mangrovi]|uniref:ABC transporter ATP-binding protein n=1 Tax=Microbacterium mangrovi TaxID=1348253 RepID=A0A0B1ZWM5_9MICO|nr:ATP-binding cassette domain-containing protein [Microbacterium mangrovi]KHK95625.1 ABC transporter ATP-binding protein [Microbacterium mangrovi]